MLVGAVAIGAILALRFTVPAVPGARPARQIPPDAAHAAAVVIPSAVPA